MGAQQTRTTSSEYAKGLGRAFIGALLFALPLFMTMEMWWFGFTIERYRLVILLVVSIPLLIALSHIAGFEQASSTFDHVLDVFAAFAIAVVTAAITLVLIGVLASSQSTNEIIGKVAVAAFPASIGALLADKQLTDGASPPRRLSQEKSPRSYVARLFVMMIGALFVALNVAPTEEMIVIAFQINAWHAALLAVVTLLLLHLLLFTVEFPGRAARKGEASFLSVLLRYSFAGYGLCTISSAALLWTFGRFDEVSTIDALKFVVVLSFPAAVGAGLAHFVVGENVVD